MRQAPGTNEGGSEKTERLLLQKVVAQDRAAFEELYRNYHPRLSRFLIRTTQRQELADEAINETLWVVWNSAGNFRACSRVSTWIMGIAYHCALKALQRSRAGVPTEELSSEHPDEGVQEQKDARDLHEWIDEGLRRLPVAQSTAIELAYYYGYTAEEIAEITNSTLGTVKARMFHARQRLRILLPGLGGYTTLQSA